MQATQLRLKREEAEEEAKKQQAEVRRLAVRNKDLESRSQVPYPCLRLLCAAHSATATQCPGLAFLLH